MGGLAGMVAQGAAWGTGTSIARAAVGSMMGGGGGHEAARPAEEPRQAAPSSNPCVNQMKLFSDCINENSGEIAKCQIYLDMVQACKRGSSREASQLARCNHQCKRFDSRRSKPSVHSRRPRLVV